MRIVTLLLALLVTACQKLGSADVAATAAPQRAAFKWVGYDATSATLTIQFQDGARSNFAGLPPDVYEGFLRSSEKHVYFSNVIQRAYEGRAVP